MSAVSHIVFSARTATISHPTRGGPPVPAEVYVTVAASPPVALNPNNHL
jgi:hypothetical protein